MGVSDFWLQLNNGKKYNLKYLKDIKLEDIAKNSKLQKFIKLFDFDGSGAIENRYVNSRNEWKSIFTELIQAAADNNLTEEEFQNYISAKLPDEDLNIDDLSELLDISAKKSEEKGKKLNELGFTENAYGEVKGHYAKNPKKEITFKKIGNARNGRSICVDKKGNYFVIAHDGTILKTDFVKNSEIKHKRNEEAKTRSTAKESAKEFYQIADDNSGMNSILKMQKLLDTKVNAKNITQFLDEYDKFKQNDSSIIDTIISEIGASGSIAQKKVLTALMMKLSEAARETGVSEEEIKKANEAFLKAYNTEYKSINGAFRKTNPKDMEKAMDFLRGSILAKQNGTSNTGSTDAIKQFKNIARTEHNSAVKDFNNAREEEGWTAKVGDTVCGWFGCNTISDLNKKLGKNKEFIQALVNSKSEQEFRQIYKNGVTTPDGRKIEGFGVDFDSDKINARQNAIEKYSFALNCNNTIETVNKILKHTDTWNYNDMSIAIRKNFKYDNETLNQIIDSYAKQKGLQNPAESDKKAILIQFLKETKTGAGQELKNITNGKSLEQMGKDIELITRSTFGTNDIVKDVIQFNENQQITEMVTEAGFEIAGTIALQFVPGLGQVAAARLAMTASRMGLKAVKVANFAVKAETTFGKIKRVQQGAVFADKTTKTAKVAAKAAQVGTQMASAGVATAAVDLSDGKSVKDTMHKTLMNMSFAGVGASSSILAPKLMQAFGIADKALATEIAEEIINAAGSYGVTKFEGGEYGSTDAFIDFASGLVMSRISHVKSSKKSLDIPTDSNGNPIAGGISEKKDGLWSRFKEKLSDKLDVRFEYEKAAASRAALKNQQAIDNGLDEAIAQGKVNPRVKELMTFEGSNQALNDATLPSSVSDRLVKALELERQGKSFVKPLKGNIDLSQISKYVPDGEVCMVNGKLYVNDNGSSIPINMSQQKFEQLFPPLKCASMQQYGGTHVCAATSQINSMLDTPGGRARLFSMLEECSDGSIVVHLQNGKRPVKFPQGKPVKMETRFLSGAPDGVLMIEQAFMADNIKRSSISNVTDISTISSEKLGEQAKEVTNRRTAKDTAEIIGGSEQKFYNTYDAKTKTLKDDIREHYDKFLNNFVPGQDVMVAHWDGHAKAIVDYDKVNQIVTYRDPMSPGVDMQCTFIQFMHKGSHSEKGYGMWLSLQKRTPVKTIAGTSRIESGTVLAGDNTNMRTVAPEKRTQPTPKQEPVQKHSESQYEYKFEERTTQLQGGQLHSVAKTINGDDIQAMLLQHDGSVKIIKEGKETIIPVEKGESIPVFESGTETYIIITKDNYGNVTLQTSQTPDLPAHKQPVELVYNTTKSQTDKPVKQKPALEIPAGAKYIDTVTIFGKPCRRIQMPNGEYYTEMNGKWKKLQ